MASTQTFTLTVVGSGLSACAVCNRRESWKRCLVLKWLQCHVERLIYSRWLMITTCLPGVVQTMVWYTPAVLLLHSSKCILILLNLFDFVCKFIFQLYFSQFQSSQTVE